MKKDYIIKWFDSLDSTNNEAMRNMDSAPDMSVWAAKFQTAGRGQRGNTWESADNENLTFSLLLKPEYISPARQFLISEAVSLAVCDYLERKGIETNIKWPNDIYVGDRKICGILIEHSLMGDRLSASIVGVGLNVNQKEFVSDAKNPVSMNQLTHRTYRLEEELNELLVCFAADYAVADSVDFASVEQRYLEKMYRRGEEHSYVDTESGRTFRGVIMGVDEYACLRVMTESGERRFAFKEIAYIL